MLWNTVSVRSFEKTLLDLSHDQFGTHIIFIMSLKYFNPKMRADDSSNHNGSRERLGLSFTIDYLLFNKGVKGSTEEPSGSHTVEQTTNNLLTHQYPEPKEVGIHSNVQNKTIPSLDVGTVERKVKEEEGEEEVTTTTTSLSNSPDKSADKPNQSYIALISKAILASEHKQLLLCDIYQWIMDHYPYFKSKVCI